MSEKRFGPNQRVVCIHHDQPYEARIIKLRDFSDPKPYFVHYVGWNKKWDEWADKERVLEYSEENLGRSSSVHRGRKSASIISNPSSPATSFKKEPVDVPEPNGTKDKSKNKQLNSSQAASILDDESNEDKPSLVSLTLPTPDSPQESLVSAPKKRKSSKLNRDEVLESLFTEHHDTLSLPFTMNLKKELVNDWRLVGSASKLVKLPASKTIQQIFHEFVQDFDQEKFGLNIASSNDVFPFENRNLFVDLSQENDQTEKHKCTKIPIECVSEMTKGLTDYFNAHLGAELLYDFERNQYDEIVTKLLETDEKASDSEEENKEVNIDRDDRASVSPFNYDHKYNSFNKIPDFSSVYGSIHLLRLLYKMPTKLAYFEMDQAGINFLSFLINNLLAYLNERHGDFFSDDLYKPISNEYLRKSA